MKRPVIIGVMGGGSATAADMADAYFLGQRIAGEGWVLLNGGRNAGIMAASAKGAAEAGGLTIGILPDDHDRHAAPHVQIPVLTGIGSARNCINILTSHVVVACAGGMGTLSEIALALKYGRPVVLLNFRGGDFFEGYADRGLIRSVETVAETAGAIKTFLSRR